MSFITGTSCELIYSNIAAGTAKASASTEQQLNLGTDAMGIQAELPPYFFAPTPYGIGKAIHIIAEGIFSVANATSPNYTFTIRLGASGTSGPIVLGSAAIAMGSSAITTKMFRIEGTVQMRTLGAAGANSTCYGAGLLWMPSGPSPFEYEMWGGAAQPGTVATVDASITNFINVNFLPSVSNASNSAQLLSLKVFGLN